MGITTERNQELLGTGGLVAIGPFGLIEASVAAEATIPLVGAVGSEGSITAPFPGRIVAISVGSEADANFTIKPTIDGAEVDAGEVTVDGAKVYGVMTPDADLVFSAGETLGLEVGADTTSKDVRAFLIVLFDVGD